MSLARIYARALFEVAKGGSTNGVGTQRVNEVEQELARQRCEPRVYTILDLEPELA